MKKIIIYLALLFWYINSGYAGTPVLTLQKSTKICITDGVANTDGSEPWGTTWIPMTAKKTSNTVDEISARFQLAFNDSYLWIACEQQGNTTMDTDHTSIPNSYERDNFDLFISMDTTSWIYHGAYGQANNDFRLQRAADYPWSFDDCHSIGHDNSDFSIGQVDAGDGSFIQEWQIPWAGLIAPMTDSGYFNGQYFRFEIMAADNTTGMSGGRNDIIFWKNNTDNEWNDSRTHSLVMLNPPVNVPMPIDSISFSSPDSNTIWSAGDANNIYFFYKQASESYNYSIGYKKAGASSVLIKNLYSGGALSVNWTIDLSEAGKYNIVLYDHYSLNSYYSDTFTIIPPVPNLKLKTPVSHTYINSESKFYITWSAYNSGNINVEISENGGVSWDTLAKNVTSNNSLTNSYQVTAPEFTSSITNGILKISNISNTLNSQVINLNFTVNTPLLIIHKTSTFCSPDGIANTDGSEPWTSDWIPMTAEKTSNTVHEISAQFQLAYNDTYLWIACEQLGNSTMDTDHTAIPNSYERDNFEVFISMDTTSWRHNGVYGEYNNQFRMQRAAEFPWSFDDCHSIGHDNPDFSIGQVDAGDGSFIQEWQIPWAGLIAPMTDSGYFNGQYFRFEIMAADNTTGMSGGRNDIIFWKNNTDNEWNDSRTHSLVMLNPPVIVPMPIDSISFSSPDSNTIWSAGNTNNIKVFYTLASGSYNYSISYKKVGASSVLIKNLYSGGAVSVNWTIDLSEAGKYNIVLYDHYSLNSYYSDTFTIIPPVPNLKLKTPVSHTYINSESKFYITWSAYNSGNINIEISENGGVSWDTLAKYVTSNNSLANSYQVTAPTFTSSISSGILKISNISNSLYSQVGNLHFNVIIPGSNTPALTLHKSPGTCTPDGIINTNYSEPWTNTWISMTAAGTTNTTAEMSARFQLACNDEYFWIACEQLGNMSIDTDHTTIPNSYERDDFEIFISMDTTSWIYSGSYGEANNQFRMQRGAVYPWGFDDFHSIAYNNPDFQIGQVDAGDGSFTQEWQIPWTGLVLPMVDSGAFDGVFFKFEIQAADNTTSSAGGRTEQLFWRNNSDNEWNDSRTHSLIKLETYCCDDLPVISINSSLVKSLDVYPNPFKNEFKISYDLLNQTHVEIGLYDLLGKYIKTVYSGKLSAGKQIQALDVYELKSGVYLLQLKTSSGIINRMIVKK